MPQTEEHAKTINGQTYAVHKLPPRAAMALLVDLSKVIGPSIGELADASGKKGILSVDTTSTGFAKAAEGFCQRLDKDTLYRTVDELAVVTMVDGKPLAPIFDIHFMGKMGELFQWLAYALQVQYSDFFGVMTGGAKALRK